MTDALVVTIQDNEAQVNVTYAGQNGELPDPVFAETTDTDLKTMVTEALRAGSIPGVGAHPNADLHDFIVDRYPPSEARPWKYIQIRPKTAYGAQTPTQTEVYWEAAGHLAGTKQPGLPAADQIARDRAWKAFRDAFTDARKDHRTPGADDFHEAATEFAILWGAASVPRPRLQDIMNAVYSGAISVCETAERNPVANGHHTAQTIVTNIEHEFLERRLFNKD